MMAKERLADLRTAHEQLLGCGAEDEHYSKIILECLDEVEMRRDELAALRKLLASAAEYVEVCSSMDDEELEDYFIGGTPEQALELLDAIRKTLSK
jgi:hypothetical protein